MYIKSKYRTLNRITVFLSVPFAGFCYLQEKNIRGAIFITIIVLAVVVTLLDHKKNKEIDRYFGVLKRDDYDGERWVGEDGLWHDCYSEIISKKEEKFYDNGGDFGHVFGWTSWGLYIMGSACLCAFLAEKIEYFSSDLTTQIIYVILAGVCWGYPLIRKTVWG